MPKYKIINSIFKFTKNNIYSLKKIFFNESPKCIFLNMIFNFETEKTSDKWFKMSKLKCGLYVSYYCCLSNSYFNISKKLNNCLKLKFSNTHIFEI